MHQTVDLSAQILRVDRLGYVTVHSGGHTTLTIPCERGRGYRNNRYSSTVPVVELANRLCGCNTVYIGHLNVHQDHIEPVLLYYSLNRFTAVICQRYHMAELCHQSLRDPPVHHIIVDNQNSEAPQRWADCDAWGWR